MNKRVQLKMALAFKIKKSDCDFEPTMLNAKLTDKIYMDILKSSAFI